MPVAKLVLSNHTEALASAFVDAVQDQRKDGVAGLFTPVCVVVPTLAVGEYLKRCVALRLGVAANIDAQFLPGFLGTLAGSARPGARIIDRRVLLGWLLGLLADARLVAAPEFAEIAAYLAAAGHGVPAVDRRRRDLAVRLAHLFDDWMLDSDLPAGARPWQAVLWRHLFGDQGLAREVGPASTPRWISLPEWIRGAPLAELECTAKVHVFGPAPWNRLFESALPRLATVAEVVVYALGARPPDDHPWARPGRDQVLRLFAAHPGLVTETRFVQPAAEPDFAVLACPSVRREAESIAIEIWRLLRARSVGAAGDAPLRFSDIAVVVPAATAEAYFSHLRAAFREAGDIPHQIHGCGLGRSSRVVEAFELLLDLPLSDFTRQDLLRLGAHPGLGGRFAETTPDDWRRLVLRLGIVRGAQHADHQGTYIDSDTFNWDQGLRRFALGAFMAPPGPGDGGAVRLAGEDVLPADLSADDVATMRGPALLLRSLLADATFARSARMPLSDWVRFLRAWLSCTVVGASSADERALVACDRELAAVGETPVPGDMSYALAADLARQALSSLVTTRASHPTAGVTVSSFVHQRTLPFRAIFVAGLGAGSFPSADAPDELDPRGRSAGTPPSEQDRFMLFERLLSGRQSIVLSFVGRDLQTGEHLEPSSSVTSLLEARGAGSPDSLAWRKLVRIVPLHRHDDPTAAEVFPAVADDHAALRLRVDLLAGVNDPPGDVHGLARVVAPATLSRLAGPLGLPPVTDGPALVLPGGESQRLRFSDLRRFLECPLQGFARARLGLHEADDDEDRFVEDEPFTVGGAARTMLLRAAFLCALRAASRGDGGTGALAAEVLARHHDEVAAAWHREGRLPVGAFWQVARAKNLEVLGAWAADVLALADGRPWTIEVVHFGGTDQPTEDGTLAPALVLQPVAPRNPALADSPSSLVGSTCPLLRFADGGLTILVLVAAAAKKDHAIDNRRRSLQGFMDVLALSASGAQVGLNPPQAMRVAVLRPGAGRSAGGAPFAIDFDSVPPDLACAVLAALIDDLCAGAHDYLMPCEAVFACHDRPTESLTDLVVKARDNQFSRCSSFRGPVRYPERYPPIADTTGRAFIERRFALYFCGKAMA